MPAVPAQRPQGRQGGEVRSGHGDPADAEVHRDPALPRPVDVLQVKQQRELVDDQGQAAAVADRHGGMRPEPVGAAHGDRADSRQHPDAPQVVVQVLAARADVLERPAAGPDAPGDRADRPECRGEGDPARQGGPLTLVKVVAQHGAQPRSKIVHTRTIRRERGRGWPIAVLANMVQDGLMRFQHSAEIWHDFPALVPVAMLAPAIRPDVSVGARVASFAEVARSRLASARESDLPEIQAWRRAFARMGLKPTQYRCAAESLLRRFRKDGVLPQLHPLVDLCNAASLAFAIPVAAFDVATITGDLDVRYAAGVEEKTTAALIVAEAMHEPASSDMRRLMAAIADDLAASFGGAPQAAVLSPAAPRFTFAL